MILCLDSETTGLPDWKSPSDADHQPHLVQLAMVLLEDDFTERAHVSMIIKPEGWVIPQEVTDIHGISHAMAEAVGVPEKLAARLFGSMLYTTGAKAVGHNVAFDLRIMRIALLRAGYTKEQLDSKKPETFCTMGSSTHLVNLPPTAKMLSAGFNKPKAPKLSECIEHFFGEPMVGAHDAMNDCRASLRIFRHLSTANKPAPIMMKEPIGTDLGAEDVI